MLLFALYNVVEVGHKWTGVRAAEWIQWIEDLLLFVQVVVKTENEVISR